MARHVTITDLARRLGLSPSTVSRALRDHPKISEATKERVLAMAAQTRYQPNLIAQSLQNRRSNNIGVIVPEIRNTFFATVISGIEEVAYRAGYTIMVCQSADTVVREQLNVRALAANRVAGLMVSVSQETENVDHLQEVVDQGIPLVLFDRVVESFAASKVVVDDFAAAYGLVQHLIEMGRSRIAHIGGTRTLSISRNRRQGYLAALADSGLAARQEYNLYGGHHEEDGRRGVDRLLALPKRPDAIFAVNDPVAIGAFVRLSERGVRIPQDMALAGFSNNPNTALVRPQLTTVDQPAFEIGRQAAELLVKILQQTVAADHLQTLVLPTRLIVRQSTL
ncbi:MAG: LacI family DNA-binding transcriptional regulator [Desulfopila sp.]